MKLYLPRPEELLSLHSDHYFRGWRLESGALPARSLLRQGLQTRDFDSLPYRWSIPYLIVVREPGLVVGSIGGKGLLPDEDEVEIAYNIAAAYRRRGYAREAMGMLQELARKDSLALLAHVEPDNTPSKKLLEKARFALETVFRLPDSLDLERWRWLPD